MPPFSSRSRFRFCCTKLLRMANVDACSRGDLRGWPNASSSIVRFFGGIDSSEFHIFCELLLTKCLEASGIDVDDFLLVVVDCGNEIGSVLGIDLVMVVVVVATGALPSYPMCAVESSPSAVDASVSHIFFILCRPPRPRRLFCCFVAFKAASLLKMQQSDWRAGRGPSSNGNFR